MHILFIADPLESFRVYKDSTFTMMREAARRGHRLLACEPRDLSWRSGGPVVARVRETHEPMLVEIRTYRFRGHSMSDPGKYRTADELEEHKRRDPVARSRADLVAAGHEAEVAAIDARVEDAVADAVRFADEAPEPGPDILEPTTYAGPFAR